MRFLSIILIIASTATSSFAQGNVRKREIDYTQYDKLVSALGYSSDRLKAANNLLTVSNQLFTPEDEEYFNTRTMVAPYFSLARDYSRAAELTQEMITAYEKYYPFYTRSAYSSVTLDQANYAYVSLGMYLRSLGLAEKAIKYFEDKRSVLENSPAYYVRQQFYTEYAQCLLAAERYDDALAVVLKLRALTEQGALALDSKSADELYKINATDPVQVQEIMRKAKEDYIKTMKETQDYLLSTQRMNYNLWLSMIYAKQYKYTEALPYYKAVSDEQKKIMDYSRQAMAKSSQLLSDPSIPDSLKRRVDEGSAYIKTLTELGGNAAYLLIAAAKSNQLAAYKQYATGEIDKAVEYQMEKQFARSEEQYQKAFASLVTLSKNKSMGIASDIMKRGYMPLYLNLQVQSGRIDDAYRDVTTLLKEEEDKLKKNFQLFSESEKKEFFNAYNQKLEQYYSLLLLMNEKDNTHAAELLDKILQTKGVILDMTRAQEKLLKKITDKATIAQINQIRKLRDKLAGFYQLSLTAPSTGITDSINRNSIRIAELEKQINAKLGTIADVLKTVSWKEVQAKLKPDEVYLEILRLKRDNFSFDKPVIQYWALVIKPGSTAPELIKLSEGETFEGRGLKNYQNRMRSLLDDDESYNVYWTALTKSFGTSTHVLMSSDGVYHIINPLTLKNPQSGKYVLDEIALTRVSTGRDLLVDAPLAPANKNIALIGNPEFKMSRKGSSLNHYQGNEFAAVRSSEPIMRSGMAELPGTLKEVESIQVMAVGKGITSSLLSGAQATEAGVKTLKSPQILHLATHGDFDPYSRADSYLKAKLILAGAADDEDFTLSDYAKYEDGFLTAYEVTQLELSQTNLVVLSACETGTGEIQSGEGVWGLQRAFQLAGAKTVMGSLWKISDEATVTFMEAFYKNYFSGAGINASYVAAMKATMNAYPHPYYWGAFVLNGVR